MFFFFFGNSYVYGLHFLSEGSNPPLLGRGEWSSRCGQAFVWGNVNIYSLTRLGHNTKVLMSCDMWLKARFFSCSNQLDYKNSELKNFRFNVRCTHRHVQSFWFILQWNIFSLLPIKPLWFAKLKFVCVFVWYFSQECRNLHPSGELLLRRIWHQSINQSINQTNKMILFLARGWHNKKAPCHPIHCATCSCQNGPQRSGGVSAAVLPASYSPCLHSPVQTKG